MRKPANIFLLAIIVGALSAAMIYRHLKTMNMEVEAARAAGQHPVTDVVVARDTISIGTRVSPDSLKVVTWPADALPEGAVHDPQEVVGSIARTTIGKNQPVAKTGLIAQGAGLLPLRNYRDEELVQTTGTSAAAMFHDEPPAGPVALASNQDTSGSCVPTGPTVEVFLGEKLVLQPMFDDKKHGWARVEGGGA